MLARKVLNKWKGGLSAIVILGAIGGGANPCTGVSAGIDPELSEVGVRSPLMAIGLGEGGAVVYSLWNSGGGLVFALGECGEGSDGSLSRGDGVVGCVCECAGSAWPTDGDGGHRVASETVSVGVV